jgi:hypothetical protein
MSTTEWEGPIPAPLARGTREGWRFSIEDPSVRFFWDGSRWATARRIESDGTLVDIQIDATRVEQVPCAAQSAKPNPRRGALLIGAVALVVLASVVAVVVASTNRSTSQQGLLQVSMAEQVYTKLVPRMDRDIDAHGSLRATIAKLTDLRNFVTPATRELILAEVACGCLQLPRIPPQSVEFSIPVQHAYPLSFLAETDNTLYQTANGPIYHYVFLTLFGKSSPNAPWEITYFLASTTQHLIQSGAVLTGTRPGASAAPKLLGLFGSAMTRARLFGAVPTDNPWHQAPSDTVVGTLFAQLEQDHRADVADRLASGAPYVISNFSPTFKTGIGTLQCATVDGEALYHDQVQASVNGTYGGFLAPGTYAVVRELTSREVCVVVSGSGVLREVEGLYGGLWRVIGTPTVTTIG